MSEVTVAAAATSLRALRRQLMHEHDLSLRELYRSLETPGASPFRDAHNKLDQAVRDAYGMGKSADSLSFLLDLNAAVADRESAGESVVGPGLPPTVKNKSNFVTEDCVSMPTLQEGH